MSAPSTRYATSGDVSIAYQVVGRGPIDLVFVMGWVSHLDWMWEEPHFARFLRRLASFSRLILFDKRGTGLSDRVPPDRLPTLEQRMDDVRAVMDAAGSERAALVGISEGGPLCALFAATHPERTHALVMVGGYARAMSAPDYRFGRTDEEYGATMKALSENWGGPVGLRERAPSLAEDERFSSWWSSYLRNSASPAAIIALTRMNWSIDIRHVLPAISVPTLVIHARGDQALPVENGRYLAQHIAGARYLELDSIDHIPFVADTDEVAGAIEEFVTGSRHTFDPDRVLATILYTDIVQSTRTLSEIGDRRWRDLLESHNGLVRDAVERARGQVIKSTGDGVLATFDGPARAVRCACAIRDAVRSLGIEVRAGLHTGECEILAGDIGGIATHIGARVAAIAEPGEVLASSTVRDLVAGSGIGFEDRGEREFKGVLGAWRVYRVVSA